MRNRFMIYRKGHSVASALLFVLLIAHLLLPPLAWLGSAAGFPLGNLFSSEGVRWYYLHIQDCYRSPFMAVVFPVVLVFGAIERSGLSEIIKDTISKGVLSLTYRQRKACLMAGTFLLLYMAGMLLLLLGPHAILLSVTGHLYPSPFVSGILQTMSLGFVLTSLLYAVLSFHLRGSGRNACLYCIGESNVMMYGFLSPCWPRSSTMPYAMYGTEPKEDVRKVFKA